MKISLSDAVKVRLTPKGREVLALHHLFITQGVSYSPVYTPPREDSEGWSTWTLGSLVQTFGHLMKEEDPVAFESIIEIPGPANP